MAKRVRVSGLPPIKPTRIVSPRRGPRGPKGDGVNPSHVIHVAESGGDYTNIQQAIDRCAAEGGGAVSIYPGTYAENITVPDGVTVVGHGMPVLDGNLTIETGGWARFLKVLGTTTGLCSRKYISLLNNTHGLNVLPPPMGGGVMNCSVKWDGRRYPNMARAYLEVLATTNGTADVVATPSLYNLNTRSIVTGSQVVFTAEDIAPVDPDAIKHSGDIRDTLWNLTDDTALLLYMKVESRSGGSAIIYDVKLALDLLE